MSLLTQFAGGARVPKNIVNGFSSGGVSVQNLTCTAAASSAGAKQILSGSLTATTYKELLSVLGAGQVMHLSAVTLDVTSRTIGLKVILDGVTVFDATSNAIAASGSGVLAIGTKISTNFAVIGARVPFNTSLSVLVKSSLSEIDKVALETIYETN